MTVRLWLIGLDFVPQYVESKQPLLVRKWTRGQCLIFHAIPFLSVGRSSRKAILALAPGSVATWTECTGSHMLLTVAGKPGRESYARRPTNPAGW